MYIYLQAWTALQHLAIDQGYLGMLHDITDNDLMVAGDLTDEWRFGQQLDALPWFWHSGGSINANGP